MALETLFIEGLVLQHFLLFKLCPLYTMTSSLEQNTNTKLNGGQRYFP